MVELSGATMNVGQKYFPGPTKLTRGITLGVHHMFEAKQVILQVSGAGKKEIVERMYRSRPILFILRTYLYHPRPVREDEKSILPDFISKLEEA